MKRLKKIFSFILLINIIVNTSIIASTYTYQRTEDDLKINSNIKVSETVKKAALATPKVDANEKIYDFAELLTDMEEVELYSKIINFIDIYNMDMVIVTINDNNKSSSMAYADDFYDYNDFGIGSNFDGLLFLIDMDNRKMWISTTGYAVNMYNDYRIDKILDETYKYISQNKYYECANAFVEEASIYASSGLPSSSGNYTKGDKKTEFPIKLILLVSLIVSSVFVLIARAKHKTIKKSVHAKYYILKDSFKLTKKEDRFVNSHTSKIYDPPSSSSSGGSSSHSSSSGRSHGGGGRSF